jgi:hypothetical protein
MPAVLNCMKKTVPSPLVLGKAVEYALNIGVDRIWQRVQFLAG